MPQRNKSRKENPLRKYRLSSGLTVRDLADRLGYRSTDAVYRLLRYENGPSTDVALRIAALLGVPVADVIFDYAQNRNRRAQ